MQPVGPLAGRQRLALVGERAAAAAVVERDRLQPEGLPDRAALAQTDVDRHARNAQLLRPLGHRPPFAAIGEHLPFRALAVGRAAVRPRRGGRRTLRRRDRRLERARDRPAARQAQPQNIGVDAQTRRPAGERQPESQILVCLTFHLSGASSFAR